MRAVAVALVLGMAAWPVTAGAKGGGARAHQERAFAALEAGDHATAAAEFFEAFWMTRNINLLLGAAQEAELAGLGQHAATYYYLYANLARLPEVEAEVLRRKVTEQHWSTGRPAAWPAPPPASLAAPPERRVVASSIRRDPDDDPPPFAEPFPDPDSQRPTLRPVSSGDRLRMRGKDKVDSVWYGRQVIVAEAISLTTLIAGLEADSSEATALGVLGCLLGAPVVHLANGKGGSAWLGAWGLRLLGIIAIGAAADSTRGVLFGYAVGAAVDVAFMARKDVRRRKNSVTVVPTSRGLHVAWTF